MVRLPAADASKFPAQNYGTGRQRESERDRERGTHTDKERHTYRAHRQTLASRLPGATLPVLTAFESKIIHIRKLFEPNRRWRSQPSVEPSFSCQINDDI